MKSLIIIFVVCYLSQTFGFECGKVQQATGLIHGGSATSVERWPFAASLHHKDHEYKFFCGGTIISQQHILTGATCIRNKHLSENLLARSVKVSVGHSDLSALSPEDLLSVQSLIVHEDWNPMEVKYDADIAIVVLDRNLVFSNKIQPACLPQDNSITSITAGYVTGWGKSEDTSKLHESVLHHVATNAVNDTVCFLTNYHLAQIASYRTFCAGGNGKGPCIGDSGSGMFVKIGDAWSLKGIVSSALIKDNGCDTDSFAIFTDVYKFHAWIKKVIGTK